MHAKTAILHYTAPPVIGGVEAVIQAHARVFDRMDYPLTVIAGRGDARAFPGGVEYLELPEIDSQQEQTLAIFNELVAGRVPPEFERRVERFVDVLGPLLQRFDHLIVHNLFTKQYNLPLSAALLRLLDAGALPHTLAWVHDIAWTSTNSRGHLHAGYPWDVLKTYRPELTYITVSRQRQEELAELFGIDPALIDVIYNGVDVRATLNLSEEGAQLIERLDLLAADLILLMPVRVTRLKNVEFAMQVLAELKQHVLHPRLVLTGPPDPHNADSVAYFEHLKALSAKLGVEREMHFVYESGPDPAQGYEIGPGVVGDLYRISDLLFMPSHSEGFGMPVLEAGLAGIPVFATPIPAAAEIGQDAVHFLDIDAPPAAASARILDVIRNAPQSRLRRKVRRQYTWEAIFLRKIMPHLATREDAVRK